LNTSIIESTISQCIAEFQSKQSAPVKPRNCVTDGQVAARIRQLAASGYIPSAEIVGPVCAYMQGYGILLTGRAGCGKTMLMRMLMATRGEMQHVDEILDWGADGIPDWHDFRDGREVCIDDLGSERVVSEYGNKDDLLKLIIGHRCERQNGRTHITTNLTAEQIAARYGDRVLDRILGMCKPFVLTGPSRREAKALTLT